MEIVFVEPVVAIAVTSKVADEVLSGIVPEIVKML